MSLLSSVFAVISIIALISCDGNIEWLQSGKHTHIPLFVALDSSATGIQFQNTIYNQKESNIFNYRNFYNGGGVGIGDINNDGLPDIYLTSNLEENKLYLNKGGFKFKDITQFSRTSGSRAWSTGVAFVDINADGLLDIYVCNAGNFKSDDKRNELFINNGDLTFDERAEDYNLAGDGFTTHSTFFDYDLDGDLDAYILNNSFLPVNTLNYSNKRELLAKDWNLPEMFKGGGDQLLRNDNGKYTDVSTEAGIYGSLIGFGLGIAVSDINKDNYPDIYISNDFFERDYLYLNNKDGTFSEEIEKWTAHISMFSMGADIGDINNDGKPDIYVTDMLPEGDTRLKSTTNFDTYDLQVHKKNQGFYHQSMQNTLQLNMGNDRFHEISHFANVSKTDWSWGALMFDMDNDGYKDIFVSNGINKDLTNQDFIDFFANDIIQKMVLTGKKEEIQKIIEKMPSQPIANYAFHNNGHLQFSNKSTEWGLDQPGFSNGSAYGDFDNDGDLDLVVNNVNHPVSIYENRASDKTDNHYIKFKLIGKAPNTFAIGSKVELYQKDNTIISYELIPTRGFQSSVDYTISLGLGNTNSIDSLKVIWPDQSSLMLIGVSADTTITINQSDTEIAAPNDVNLVIPYFKELSTAFDSHQENAFVDFDYERLVSRMVSKEGPTVAVGDINSDGLEDLYIGGARGQIGSIYTNQGKGRFSKSQQTAFENEQGLEDTAAAMEDIDNDGDLDLMVSSGGNEINLKQANINRLYVNNGSGLFDKAKILPSTTDNVSVIAVEDFDEDGDIDLFIGARSVPGIYGLNPKHLLLQNDGQGNFKNIINQSIEDAKHIGMVTDATWANIDTDGRKELVLTVEWGAPIIFKRSGEKLIRFKTSLDSKSGWWQSLHIADINMDGHNDLVLGNTGLNTAYKASLNQPMRMYINDFDKNGMVDQIVTRQIQGRDKPIATKHDLTKQLPHLNKQNLSFSDYASKSINELFDDDVLTNALVKTSFTGQSIVAINDGYGDFGHISLPNEAQLSSINSILTMDIDRNGSLDIIYGGNNYDVKPQFARLDASFGGVILSGTEDTFRWVPYNTSGFFVEGKITSLVEVSEAQNTLVVVGINDERPKIFSLNEM